METYKLSFDLQLFDPDFLYDDSGILACDFDDYVYDDSEFDIPETDADFEDEYEDWAA